MATYAEASLNEKNTNPAGDIFLMKNHFGYRDQREQVVARVDATPQLESGKEAAEKYAKLVGVQEFPYQVLNAPANAQDAPQTQEKPAN